MKTLSLVIPAHNEEENIGNTVSVIEKILKDASVNGEIIFIDDGSTDRSWEIIKGISENYAKRDSDGQNSLFRVRGLKFSRNFGKEGAIFAGLQAAKGDCAIVIDCDLQHPPEIIPKMYKLWEDGYEVIEAVKASRGNESILYRMFAKMFYGLMRGSSEVKLERASDYKLLDRKVLNALLEMPERLTFFRALSSWVGFKSVQVEFDVQPRYAGTTKWNFFKLFRFAVNNLTSFTGVPLQIVTFTGVIFFFFGVAVGINTLYNFFMKNAVTGFTTVIILQLLIGSFILLGLGIIGFYIQKIYEEIKFRPRYIISETAEGNVNAEEIQTK